MSEEKRTEKEFTQRVNESQGIIHKVCRMYCDDETHREDLFQELARIGGWRTLFKEKIDNLRFSETTLSASEVKFIYAVQKTYED